MKIVIDIDKEIYDFIKNRGHIPYEKNGIVANAIINGTPLQEFYPCDECEEQYDCGDCDYRYRGE